MRRQIFAAPRFALDLLLRFIRDDGLSSAGYLAYVGLMTLLPFLVFVFSLLGLVGQAEFGARLVSSLLQSDFMPRDVGITLEAPIRDVISRSSGDLLTISFVVVLWISGSGVEGIRSALNRAYRTAETRSYWRRRGQGTLFVLVFSAVILAAAICVVLGPVIWLKIANVLNLGMSLDLGAFPAPIRFGIGTLSLFVVTAALYHLLPDHRPRLIDVVPGAVAVCAMVTGATSVFAFYLEHFGRYSLIYGSLGGVISTLVFFYMLGAIFVLGAEFNAMLSEKNKTSSEENS